MRRIHIIGGPGAGKTTLARELARRLSVPWLDLDGTGLDIEAGMDPVDFAALAAARQDNALSFAEQDAWVSEGSNTLVAQPLFQRAEAIVVLYTPWRIASYRILSRHVKLTLARRNRFPGWRNLYRFWRWSAHYYANTNPPGLNAWGTPTTADTMEQELAPFEDRIVRCRTKAEIEAFVTSLVAELAQSTAAPGGQ